MILEALRHLLIPCPARLKRLGVLHDLIALEARARRQQAAWAPHREACQQAILDWTETAPDHALAVVVGSGLLLEVPLEALAARFERVICLDLYHMPAVRRRAARLDGVTLIDHDVTGLLQTLPEDLKAGRLPAPQPSLPFAGEAGLVVSANVASQLALIPQAAAEARGGRTPLEIADWARSIVASHFDALRNRPGTVGLICDVERRQVPVGGTEPSDWWDLLEGAALPPLTDRRDWWWEIAPAPEEDRHHDYRHHVVAGVVADRA